MAETTRADGVFIATFAVLLSVIVVALAIGLYVRQAIDYSDVALLVAGAIVGDVLRRLWRA